MVGFEGEIITLKLKDYYWKVMVKWRDAEVRIVTPQERFPQLKGLTQVCVFAHAIYGCMVGVTVHRLL